MPTPSKSSRYAIAASKGFSYYLPKPAQYHLRHLLKQLPSPARCIYNEYYRDVMCAKACAPASAAALAQFVTQSFPAVAQVHNAFARAMNEEIGGHEHEGFVAVLFPVVGELGVGLWDEGGEGGRGKRDWEWERDTDSTVEVLDSELSSEEVKKGVSVREQIPTAREGLGLVTPFPSSPLSARTPFNDQSPSITAPEDQLGDTTPLSPTPSIVRGPPASSAGISATSSTNEDHWAEEDNDPPLSDQQAWQQGLNDIEEFPWTERPGSRWVDGRGRVSIYYETEKEVSAGLFGGRDHSAGEDDDGGEER